MILRGDCLLKLREMKENSVDAIVTDPPYGLKFMGKSWDYDVPAQHIWEECLRVLKPGGHLLSFFGTRTYHRGVSKIEDAGFEIRDQIQWLYGSGFPKSLDISKAIDKMHGAEREVVGVKSYPREGTTPVTRKATSIATRISPSIKASRILVLASQHLIILKC
jgi:SAM-dependent methyltransferase